MIRINLIIKPRPLVRWRLALQIGGAIALLGVVSILSYSAWDGYRRQMAALAETRKLVADYTKVAGRMPALQEELDKLKAKQAGLAAIARNQRFSQSAVLRQIRSAPAGVTLESVTFAGSQVTITGEARTFAGAMQYLSYLRSAPLILGVREQSARVREDGVTTFTFVAQIRPEGEGKP